MQGRVDGQCSGFYMGYSIVTFPSHLHIYFCFVLNAACSFGRAGILWSVCSTVSGKAPATGLSWSRARRQKGAAFSIQLRKSPRLFLLLWDIRTILRQLQTVGFPLVCSQSFRSNCQQTKTKDNTRVWMLLRNKPCIRTGTILYLTKGKSLFFMSSTNFMSVSFIYFQTLGRFQLHLSGWDSTSCILKSAITNESWTAICKKWTYICILIILQMNVKTWHADLHLS